MSVLKIRDKNGNFISVPSIKGEKGEGAIILDAETYNEDNPVILYNLSPGIYQIARDAYYKYGPVDSFAYYSTGVYYIVHNKQDMNEYTYPCVYYTLITYDKMERGYIEYNDILENPYVNISEEYITKKEAYESILEYEPSSMTGYITSIKSALTTDNYFPISIDTAKIVGSKFTIGSQTSTTSGDTFTGIEYVGDTEAIIRLSGSFYLNNANSTSSMYFVTYIQRIRNGTAVILSRKVSGTKEAGESASLSSTPFLTNALPGDVFYLRMYKSMSNGKCDISGSASEMRTFIHADFVKNVVTHDGGSN